MCIVSSQACTLHQFWKILHLKRNELSTPLIRKLSKVWARFFEVPTWSHLSYKELWNSFISLPFLRNGLLGTSVDLVSCRNSQWPCSIKNLPTGQMEAVEVEILLSSQGSRIVSMKDSSIAFLSRSVLITFKSSELSKGVRPGSIEAFGYTSLWCYHKRKALYTELFSFFSPSRSIL
jgi:hypothetical protein